MPRKSWNPEPLVEALSRRTTIGISLAAVAVLGVIFRVWGALVTDDSLGIIRSQVAFTADRFEAVAGTWNIAEFIRLIATVDFIFPVMYAAVIAGVWARAAGSDQWSRSVWPAAVAFGAAAADWVENVFHLIAIEPMITGGTSIGAAVAAGSLFAVVKWIGIVVALTAAAVAAWKRGGPAWRVIGVVLAGLAGGLAGVVTSLF
jgi:hypothetical protein